MADSSSNSNHRRISPSTTTSSSSTASPSVNGQGAHRIRIRLTSNANGHNDNSESPSSHSALNISATQSPRSAIARVEPFVQGTMQNGHTDVFHDRMSESLSPAPARSPSNSPSRGANYRSAGGTSHDRTPSGTSSHNLSPTKPVRRKRPEPSFVCSRDFAPLPTETQLEPHSEAYNSSKRTELSRFKSKVSKIVYLSA